MRQVICLFVYIGKNPRFTAFLDSNLHTRLAIVTKNELGLVFPPRNLPKKFHPDPSKFYLVIVVTNKQTDRQTNAGKNIIPRFRGDNDFYTKLFLLMFIRGAYDPSHIPTVSQEDRQAYKHTCPRLTIDSTSPDVRKQQEQHDVVGHCQ